jgi:transcriptional regulator with XRE-family HTH domain
MQLRKERGWSLEKCAEACQLQGWEISQSEMVQIESGSRPVPDFEVLMLSAIFKVKASALYPEGYSGSVEPA